MVRFKAQNKKDVSVDPAHVTSVVGEGNGSRLTLTGGNELAVTADHDTACTMLGISEDKPAKPTKAKDAKSE